MKRFSIVAAFLAATATHGAVTVRDDDGVAVTLPKPAQRVISLAPHATELLFAAGGGAHIVGVVSYSDFPDAAKRIARVGDNRDVDLERLVALNADLLVVWHHGSSERQLEQLRRLGIPIFHSEPHRLDDIPDSLQRLGHLLGTDVAAQQAAMDLRRQLAALATRYGGRPPVRMFYQVWDKPLYTLNGAHIVSDAMRLCGGENVFGALRATAPVVDVEAVLQANPEAIFGTSERSTPDGGVDMWRAYPAMAAVQRGNLFKLDGNLLNRPGPRMVAGTAALCEKLDLVRQHRTTSP